MNTINRGLLDEENQPSEERSWSFSKHVLWITVAALALLVILMIARALGGVTI
ncbi:MAG: hypothetical protein SGI77_17120 [Pirellulaceae bacterium]|nr:hypothetical protein [Pirellulaceae bacterium]